MGDDHFGKDFFNVMKADNINTDYMLTGSSGPTSTASIVVDPTGHNFCVVNFGVTNDLSPADVDYSVEAIKNSRILVTTRMIQEATALRALKLGREHGCINIFNFAPATSDLSDEFNVYVDLLIVNEVEVICKDF